jgi:serine O-acetyltransferase
MFNNLRESIAAVKERDPAATNAFSAVINYPGLHAIMLHRFHHWLHIHGLRFIARTGSQCARFLTNIEIHPGAEIGHRFFIDHGAGVVIGETTIIGDDCTLYQGVTLGGTGKETGKRHPTLEDRVTVGVGACVLGAITVGSGSKVGGGAVVIKDVPPNRTVVGIPGRVVVRHDPVVRAKRQTEAINILGPALPHEELPDPIIEVFANLMQRIKQLEAQVGIKGETPDTGTQNSYLSEIEEYAQLHFEEGAGI